MSQRNRLFGVEMECDLPRDLSWTVAREALSKATPQWTVVGDRTIGYGVEAVSPPLSGADGRQQVVDACAALSAIGCTATGKRCGLHVHHDIRGAGTSVEVVKAFVATWAFNQDPIDALVGAHRREGGSNYCKRLTAVELAALRAVTDFSELDGVTEDRCKTVNVKAYRLHGTVEVRQHGGTVDAREILSWVALGQAMLDDAEDTLKPRPRARSIRALLYALGDKLDSDARAYLIRRAKTS